MSFQAEQNLFRWKITKFQKFKKNWKSFFIIKIKVRLILSNWNVQTAKGVVKDRKLLTPKKGLSKANKVLFIFKVYEPFSLQKWHALQSEKYSVTQALKIEMVSRIFWFPKLTKNWRFWKFTVSLIEGASSIVDSTC